MSSGQARAVNSLPGLSACGRRQVEETRVDVLTNLKDCSANAVYLGELRPMSFRSDLARGSGSALYGPRISRSLVDQLESHLRTLSIPAADTDRVRAGGRIEGPAPSAVSQAPIQLRIDQLENALICVKNAAKAMAELEKQVVSMDERAGMQAALATLERRLRGFEREFATVTEQLRDAQRETEEHRQRSLVAQSKLDSLMAAVAKMIAPLGPAEVVAHHRLPPILRGALTNDEVRA